MIDREHDLPITKQAEVLEISRGSVYYLPRLVSCADLAIMRHLDRLHLEFPFAGSRMLRGLLALQGCKIGRRHVKTLMRRMGISARAVDDAAAGAPCARARAGGRTSMSRPSGSGHGVQASRPGGNQAA